MPALPTLLGGALALVTPPAAGDLVRLTAHGEPAIWYLDPSSVTRSRDLASARVVIEHRRGADVQRIEDVDVIVNCRSRTIRPVSVASLAPDGRLLARRAVSETEVPPMLAQPRTPSASVAARVCGDAGRFDYRINSALQVTGQ